MKKNGFTFIELLTVISFLSIFIVIAIPKINNSIKESRADQLQEVREKVMKATDVFLNTNCGNSSYDELLNKDVVKVYLNVLKDCGLIESKIYNPVVDNYFDIDNEYIIVKRDEVGMIEYELSF